MRVLIAAGLVIAVLALVTWLSSQVRAELARRRAAHAPWQLQEVSDDGEALEFYAARPGSKRMWLTAVPAGAADFEGRVFEARLECRMKVNAMNEDRR